MTFDVEIRGLDKMLKAFSQAPEKAKPILQQAIDRTPDILAKNTTASTVPFRTGLLVQTFKRDVQNLVARWFPTRFYAPFVEFGTRPHVILPKNKKALYWPGAAHPVRKVNHPGSKPNRFMERIRDHSTAEINDTFKEALDVFLKAISTKP